MWHRVFCPFWIPCTSKKGASFNCVNYAITMYINVFTAYSLMQNFGRRPLWLYSVLSIILNESKHSIWGLHSSIYHNPTPICCHHTKNVGNYSYCNTKCSFFQVGGVRGEGKGVIFLTPIRSFIPVLMISFRRCNRRSRSSGVLMMALTSWTQATWNVLQTVRHTSVYRLWLLTEVSGHLWLLTHHHTHNQQFYSYITITHTHTHTHTHTLTFIVCWQTELVLLAHTLYRTVNKRSTWTVSWYLHFTTLC